MPIQKRWSKFTQEKIDSAPEKPGVYELGDVKSEVVNIGSGNSQESIKPKLCRKKQEGPKTVKRFRLILTAPSQIPERLEQKHGEKFERKYGRLPRLQKRLPGKH